jgi:hypothetical protein
MATTPDQIDESIRQSIALQPDGPRFVAIGLTTWGRRFAQHPERAVPIPGASTGERSR